MAPTEPITHRPDFWCARIWLFLWGCVLIGCGLMDVFFQQILYSEVQEPPSALDRGSATIGFVVTGLILVSPRRLLYDRRFTRWAWLGAAVATLWLAQRLVVAPHAAWRLGFIVVPVAVWLSLARVVTVRTAAR